ncbi:MAG TPA: D-arabinono-1,4-lactone oxidase [Polyangia bacterium]|jgi:L-gulonolactone oxidase
MAAHTWRNWAGNQRAEPRSVHRPRSVAEVVEIVRRVAAGGERLKVVGAGHSWSDLARSDGHLLSLDRLAGVRDGDAAAGTVTVDAGMRLHALNDTLAAFDLALPSLGSIAEQTVGGVVATATHGTGARFGTLSSQVTALELVTADGRVVGCSERTEPDLFAAARCNLGSLGVVTAVTLQCAPAFQLHCVEETRRFDDVVRDLDPLVEGNEHFKLWWVPHTDVTVTFRQNRTQTPGPRARLARFVDQELLRNRLLGPVLWASALVPAAVERLNRGIAGAMRHRLEYVDRSDRVFTFPVRVRHLECEYAVPRAAAGEVLTALRRRIEERRFRVNFIVEARFVAPDDIWLSPAYRRESCYIGVMVCGLPHEAYFRDFEELVAAYGGRPHWGKLHTLTAATLRERYPAWDWFQAVRRRVDPHGRFASPALDRVLGPVRPSPAAVERRASF